jgi:hypothetical protein
MTNLARYVEQVYTQTPGKDVLDGLSNFLSEMQKIPEKMKLWDLSPVFEVVSFVQIKNFDEPGSLASSTKQLLQFALFNCEVSLDALASLCFSYYQSAQEGNVVIDAIVEKLNLFFTSFQKSNREVHSLDTLLQYVKIVALTLFDYLDIVDLPNNEVSITVKQLFRDHVRLSIFICLFFRFQFQFVSILAYPRESCSFLREFVQDWDTLPLPLPNKIQGVI